MLEMPISTRSEISDDFQDDVRESPNAKVIVLKIDPFIPDDVTCEEEVIVEANVSHSKYLADFATRNSAHDEQDETETEQNSGDLPVKNVLSDNYDAILWQKKKLFVCKHCDRSFSTKFSLFQHSRRHKSKIVANIEKENNDSIDTNLGQSRHESDLEIARFNLEPNVVHCSTESHIAEEKATEEIRVQNDSPHLVIENVRTITAESEIDLFQNEKQGCNVKTKSRGRRVKHTPSRSPRSTVKDVHNSNKSKNRTVITRRKSALKNITSSTITESSDCGTANDSKVTVAKTKKKSQRKNDLAAIRAKSNPVETKVTEAKAGPRRRRRMNSKYADFKMTKVFKEESDDRENRESAKENHKKGRKSKIESEKMKKLTNVDNNVTLPLAGNGENNIENQCCICSKTFSRKAALSSHLLIHSLSEKTIPRYMLSKNIPVRYCDNNEATDQICVDTVQIKEEPHDNRSVNKSSRKSNRIKNGKDKGKNLKHNEPELREKKQNRGRSTIDKTIEAVINQVTNSEVSIAIPTVPIKVEHFVDGRKNRSYINNVDPSTLICCICKLRFTQKKLLNDHYTVHHDMKPHLCPVCLTRYSYEWNLKTHMRAHGNIRPYTCYICCQKFRVSSALKRHLLTHQVRPKISCETCGVKFSSKHSMEAHQKKHQGAANFKCHFCPAIFVYKSRLEAHLVVHTNIRNHKCEICAKGFKLKIHLQTHMRQHFGVRNYECNYCGRKYYDKACVASHIRCMHLKKNPSRCCVCQKHFSSKLALSKHRKIHSKKR